MLCHVSCNFAAENQVQAGVFMKALLEALNLHKANAEVARDVAGAIWHICLNGIDQRFLCLVVLYGYAWLLVLQP